jgi:DNA-binding transcriptional ArsR family regulator
VETYGDLLDGLAFGALGDPTRRAVFECVAEQPRAVGELAELVPVTRPAVSQHLKVLKEAGLVTDRREGNRRIYQLDPTGIEQLRSYLDRFWGTALGAFKLAAERPVRTSEALPPERTADPRRGRKSGRVDATTQKKTQRKTQKQQREQGERSHP